MIMSAKIETAKRKLDKDDENVSEIKLMVLKEKIKLLEELKNR